MTVQSEINSIESFSTPQIREFPDEISLLRLTNALALSAIEEWLNCGDVGITERRAAGEWTDVA